MDVQARLNLRTLVQRSYAIAGINRYLFVTGMDRLLLVQRLDSLLQNQFPPGPAWVDLEQPFVIADAGSLPSLDGSPCALLPLTWSRGLLEPPAVPDASCWQCHAEPLSLWSWWQPSPQPGSDQAYSELQTRLGNYHQQLADLSPGDCKGALALLQRERPLRLQIEPACWQGAPRPSLEPAVWVEAFFEEGQAADASSSEDFSDKLTAILQLLPEPEQEPFSEALAGCLLTGLAAAEPTDSLLPWLRLIEGFVGGLNSRRPRLQQLEQACRRRAIVAALQLQEPGELGLTLMRLLQVQLVAEHPDWLAALAACVDALVLQIGAAAGDNAKAEKRRAQQQLEQLIKAGASHLLLWRQLVLQLDADTCYRLPTVQPPSACLVVLKGVLLLTSADLRDVSRATRMALVSLFERLLPRLWWQAPLLVQLLRDLRRFPIEITWLERESQLLDPWLTLQSRGLGPVGAVLAPADEPPLLQLQLLVLQRLLSQEEHRTGLAQRLAALAPSPIQRLLPGGSELPLLEAATAGLSDRCLSLLRLQAQQWGVEELLPLLPAPLDLSAAFRFTLEHWRQHFSGAVGASTLPISVVITTYSPDLPRLRLALESLALQTGLPQEILVVDDGTPEPLAAELSNLLLLMGHALGLPIRLLRQPHNQGQYACRNIAINASRGEAIAIQDDDDISHPQRLACQWQAMQQGAIAVYARHLRLDQATAHPQADGDGLGFWGDGITTLLVRRQAAVRLGGFYPVRSRGDVEFRARLRRHYGDSALRSLEQPLYLMRAASDTVSSDFEYGCSLRLRQWRRLITRQLLV